MADSQTAETLCKYRVAVESLLAAEQWLALIETESKLDLPEVFNCMIQHTSGHYVYKIPNALSTAICAVIADNPKPLFDEALERLREAKRKAAQDAIGVLGDLVEDAKKLDDGALKLLPKNEIGVRTMGGLGPAFHSESIYKDV